MFSKILSSRTWLVAIVAFATAFPLIAPAEGEVPIPQGSRTILPNIVLLLTDDQRRDTLKYMPIVQRLLVQMGVRFDNGYVENPLCCPSRASILTGTNSNTNGVYSNHGPHGGFAAFHDATTIATVLQAAGYRTGQFGKYFNGYRETTYVPPGWDRWFATYDRDSGYYGYTAVSDGNEVQYGSDPADYGQTVLRNEAVSFIEDTDASQPLFMYWATHAPHAPAIPERQDRKAFASLARWRPPSYDEADVSDKPSHVRARPPIDRATAREIDRFRLDQIRSLQSVDRSVGAIVKALRESSRLENTIIVFMSDNGMLWGEHRLHGKSEIYEEAIAVPFVVRYDAMIGRARTDEHLVLNIDLAPTFADAAGVELPDVDGRSLLPLLELSNAGWRDSFLVEHLRAGDNTRYAPTFCAVHTDRYVLVRYATGEEELYDLVRDPHQMENVADSARYDEQRGSLRGRLHTLCDPLPPGFSF
jgi:N-acetylglucosamine-6-sulfatase